MSNLARSGGIAPGLPGGTLTRRSLLRAAAPIAAGLAITTSVPGTGHAATSLHPDDARLIALADACEALERACDAHAAEHRGRATDASEEAFGALCGGFLPLEEELAATPAATIAGVVAKARALQIETCRNCAPNGLSESLADDVWRLFGGGAA